MLTYSILAIIFGVLLIIYGPRLQGFLGRIEFLENWFGSTGYGLQILGVAIVVLTVLVTTGGLNFLFSQFKG